MAELRRLVVHNYRCVRDVDFAAGRINVLFGPNGAGKTTLLDALEWLSDCAARGTAEATSARHHGVGVLADGADPDDARIDVGVETVTGEYRVTFGYSSGRIEPFAGERFFSKTRRLELIRRVVGSDQATLYNEQLGQTRLQKLRDPERLAFSNFLLLDEPGEEAAELHSLLGSLRFYRTRTADLEQIRRLGSQAATLTYPWPRWRNLGSALRNLNDRRALDDRMETILRYMRKAFPQSFRDLAFESLGPDRVGCGFVEQGRKQPIPFSGVSDGHLQLLGILVSLFGDAPDRSSLLLFDEPETSMHPYALAVLAEAITEAATHWNRQAFLATHSPVLISQFDPSDVVVAQLGEDGSTALRRVSDMQDLKALLDQYAAGSLYMAELLGRQSAPEASV